MKKIELASSIGALGALVLVSGNAMAQVEPGSQEVQAYGGQLFGDKLTDRGISAGTPELDDDASYGVRYGYNFTETWGIELSLAQANTAVTELAGSDVNVDVTLLDVDAVLHLLPNSRIVPYLVAGIGYADASFDNPIQGTVNGQPVRLDEDGGITANAGLGAKYFVNDRVMVRLDGRYRYIDKLVDRFDDSLNTFETTLGVAWKF